MKRIGALWEAAPQEAPHGTQDRTREAVAEVLSFEIAQKRKEFQERLADWRAQLDEAQAAFGADKKARKQEKYRVQHLLKDMQFEQGRSWEDDAVDREMIQEMNALVQRAKALESQMTSKAEKAFKVAGKVLITLGLVMGFKAGLDRFHSIEALENIADEAGETMGEYEAPEVPRGMLIMGQEQRPTYDTSSLFNNFKGQADQMYEHGLPFVTEDPNKDFEKVYIAYAPQFEQKLGLNFSDVYADKLAEATHRTPDQMRFVGDVANDALFAKVAGMGGGVTGALFEGQRAYDTDARKECLQKTYPEGVAFIDRVYEERLKDLPKETRNELKDELAAYLRAEVAVRLDAATIQDDVARKDVDGLQGREATSMVPGRASVLEQYKEDVQKREAALAALYGELVKVHAADPFEGKQAQALVDWRTHAPVYADIVGHLSTEMERGFFSADGELLGQLVGQFQNSIRTSKEAYRAFAPTQHDSSAGQVARVE